MATYKSAVAWIAANDEAGGTPADMALDNAIAEVEGLPTVQLAAALWGKEPCRVAADVLKARGFKIPRGFK